MRSMRLGQVWLGLCIATLTALIGCSKDVNTNNRFNVECDTVRVCVKSIARKNAIGIHEELQPKYYITLSNGDTLIYTKNISLTDSFYVIKCHS